MQLFIHTVSALSSLAILTGDHLWLSHHPLPGKLSLLIQKHAQEYEGNNCKKILKGLKLSL